MSTDLTEDQERLEEQEELDRVVEKTGLDEDIVAAAIVLGIPEQSIGEAYQGRFDTNIAFAHDMADNIGSSDSFNWPHTCVDWDFAARELMMDYSEENGYYFRNM